MASSKPKSQPDTTSSGHAPAMWTPFSYIVVNLARQIRPDEIAFSGVNSTLPMLACLLAKRAYDFHYTYLNVAGGVEPVPRKIPHSSSDPTIVAGSPAIFANEDFYDLCARGPIPRLMTHRAAAAAREIPAASDRSGGG